MTPIRTLIALASLIGLLVLAGCGSTSQKSRGGGYYKDDGPGSNIPADIMNIPDAVPRIESYAPANLRPYRVLGRTYVPITSDGPFRQTGVASWYGKKFHGRKTANGETYDMYAMTAAHPTLPLPSYARVSRPDTGASVVVRINDRGPFHRSRVIDLSYAAAARLGLINQGSGKVVVEAITHTQIARGQTGAAGKAVAVAAPPPSAQQPATPVAQSVAATPRPSTTSATPAAEATSVTLAEPVSLVASEVPVDPVPDALAALEDPDSSASSTGAPTSVSVASSYGGDTNAIEVPTPTVTATDNSGIFLQFGAFSEHANAESLSRKLNYEIAMVEPRPAQVQASENLYRVQIGPFSSRTEAVNAALRIQQHTGARATVATRD